MEPGNLTNLAVVNALPGKGDKLEEALKEVAKQTRQEPGSLVYEVHRSKADENQFLVYELWRSQADLDTHMKAAAITAFVAKVPELVDGGVDMRQFTPVDLVRL